MPVPDFTKTSAPRLVHPSLHTTFCGIEHPLSSPQAPIHQYRGIKYATIPARFRQSIIHTSYPPITVATSYGPICPQKRSSKTMEESLFGIPQNLTTRQELQQDEFDCLNLNITCPGGLTTRSRIPVMLWVHGGGDRGSGSQWFYDGGALVRKGLEFNKPVIVVTFNFRLGLLGFATNNIICEDNKSAGEHGTGNYGLRDQQRAMEWLHRYIGDFGGDPNNITLFGAGSGAADIILHLLSRANEEQTPFFQRAIVQSAIFEPVLPDVSSATWTLSRVMSALQATSIEKLRAVEVQKLVGLGQTVRAVDDGVFLRDGWQSYFEDVDQNPTNGHGHHQHHHYHHHRTAEERPSRPTTNSFLQVPHKTAHANNESRSPSGQCESRSRSRKSVALTSPSQRGMKLRSTPNRQPLIIGDNSSDALLWSSPISLWTPAGVVRRLKAICQSLSKTNGVLRAYDISPYTPPDEIMDRVLELVGDARVAWSTHCVAESAKKERDGRNVWRYVFDQEGPSRGVPHHAADLMYLFDTVPLPESAFAPMDADCTFDVSDDEESLLASPSHGLLPSTPPHHGAADEEMDDSCNFSASTFIEKCERLQNSSGARATTPSDDDEWMTAMVDKYSYARVRDALQERWISFAHGEVPWREDHVFVFGPEGETGERSSDIFEGRRRRQIWRDALEPLGAQLVQKFGVELSRGPALGADRC